LICRILGLVAILVGLTTAAHAQAVIVPSPVPACANGDVLKWNSSTTNFECSTPALSQPLIDNVGIVKDNADATKILAFEVSGITTGTTRTWTVPDANITFPSTVASLATNTFTGLQTLNGGLSATTGVFSSSLTVDSTTLYVDPTNDRVGVGTVSPGQTLDVNGTLRVRSAGSHAVGASPNARYQMLFGGAFTGNGTGVTSAFRVDTDLVGGVGDEINLLDVNATFTEAGSGTHPVLAGMRFRVPTVNAGAATVTNAATLLIDGAVPATVTGATYALWVDDGVSRFDGNVGIGTTAPQSRLDLAAGAAELEEMAAPGAPGVNRGRIYAADNGAGKTCIYAIFNSGAVQTIACQP